MRALYALAIAAAMVAPTVADEPRVLRPNEPPPFDPDWIELVVNDNGAWYVAEPTAGIIYEGYRLRHVWFPKEMGGFQLGEVGGGHVWVSLHDVTPEIDAGATLIRVDPGATLGDFTYVTALGQRAVTLPVAEPQVPEPATLALLLPMAAWVARRRRA